MPDWKDMKNGWLPGKDSSSGSSSIRGSVKGLIGRGEKSPSTENRPQPVAIGSLRDPSSFGPPPKRSGMTIAPHPPSPIPSPSPSPTSPSSNATPTAPASPARSSRAVSGTAGKRRIQAQITGGGGGEEEQQPAAAAAAAPGEPRKPWRLDTTGLQTSHLPAPPARLRRDGVGPSPATGTGTGTAPRGPPPSLPPRLPPRGGADRSSPTGSARSPVSNGGGGGGSPGPGISHRAPGYPLNQGAVDRLGAAGISVPGLGIGGSSRAGDRDRDRDGGGGGRGDGALGQLGRAVSLASALTPPRSPVSATVAASSSGRPSPPAPGNVARNNNSNNNNNTLLGELQGRVTRLDTSAAASSTGRSIISTSAAEQVAAIVGKKPAPPPPPKKKPALSRANISAGEGTPPPPVPLATRPKF